MNMISTLRRRVQKDPEEMIVLSCEEFNQLQSEWITRAMPWIDVEVQLPAIGQRVILFDNGVVQNDTYYLDAGDVSDYHTEYFWDREDMDEAVPIKKGQMWIAMPSKPKAG